MSRTQTAVLLGVSPRHFDEFVRPKLSADATRGDRMSLRFNAPLAVAKWIEVKVEQAKRKMPQGGDGDPLMAEGDSPGLERYRNAKADLAEMERDRQRKQIVRVEEIEPALMQLAGVMRSASENLARQFGNEAAGIVNEAVDEWADGVATVLTGGGTDRSSADGAEGTETADDEAVRGAGVDSTDRAACGTAV